MIRWIKWVGGGAFALFLAALAFFKFRRKPSISPEQAEEIGEASATKAVEVAEASLEEAEAEAEADQLEQLEQRKGEAVSLVDDLTKAEAKERARAFADAIGSEVFDDS